MIEFISNIHSRLFRFLAISVPETFSYVWSNRIHQLFSLNPISLWVILQLLIICILILLFKIFRHYWFWIIFEYLFEQVYWFFEEILEVSGKQWVKVYVTTLFFVILISNLSSWLLDFVRIIFVDIDFLNNIIVIPTTSMEFNIGLAVISILLVLIIQFKNLWSIKMVLEYVPIFGKNIVSIDQGNMKSYIYWPAKIVVKIFDIAISLFVGFLDIIGTFAKIISLSARLYGNMISGWVLLSMLVLWITALTQSLFDVSFPVLFPLILFAQALLVAVIQAFVFPLLVSIFIKLAQQEQE